MGGDALNANEKAVAEELIGRLEYGGYQLVAPCRQAKAPGGGRYRSPHRLRGLEILRGDFGKALFKARTAIERSFGNATAFGGGPGPPPAWVRGLERVRTWVWAKLLINAVRVRYG